jgi:hypothetical protein
MRILFLFVCALLLFSCTNPPPKPDSNIASCAEISFKNRSVEGVYKISVDKECWEDFVKKISINAPWCKKFLESGEGCEYSTKNGDFILSPSKENDKDTKEFILTDLRY